MRKNIVFITIFLMLFYTGTLAFSQNEDFRYISLKKAIEIGDFSLIETIVKNSETANLQDNDGSTLLMSAAFYGDISIIKHFVKFGADVNKIALGWKTPLIQAIRNKKTAAVEYLLQQKADVNQATDFEKTPYMFALETKNTDIIDLLKNYGARIENGYQINISTYLETPYNKVNVPLYGSLQTIKITYKGKELQFGPEELSLGSIPIFVGFNSNNPYILSIRVLKDNWKIYAQLAYGIENEMVISCSVKDMNGKEVFTKRGNGPGALIYISD